MNSKSCLLANCNVFSMQKATPPALVLELEKTKLQFGIFAQFTFSSFNFVSEIASMSGKLSSSHNNFSSIGLFLSGPHIKVYGRKITLFFWT